MQKSVALERSVAQKCGVPFSDTDAADRFLDTRLKLSSAAERYAALKSASDAVTDKLQAAADKQREYFEALLKANTWLEAAEARLANMRLWTTAGDPTELQGQVLRCLLVLLSFTPKCS